jgi:tryptophan 7-halogenase
MDQRLVKEVIILGGGTAGWMTAAALSRVLNGKVQVTVVESDEIRSVGVGEATVPGIIRYNDMLELNEDQFLRETSGTIKLGIEFVDWNFIGDKYMHGFGRYRQDIKLTSFEQVWQRLNLVGRATKLADYSITQTAAYAGRFMRPRLEVPDSPLADIAYAFHFDASLYARYLRNYAEQRGVRRVEGRVVDVSVDGVSGDIASLKLAGGAEIGGEFFVDCTGFRGRLIEEVMKSGYDDWSHWLPANRAVTVHSAAEGPLLPFTRATARTGGWQWRIPLQHRVGNGYVFSNHYVSEDQATATLLANLDGKALGSPWILQFVPGLRKRPWQRNCVAIGLASGFIEPLESTSIHQIQSAIFRLLRFFPSSTPSEADIDEYNRLTHREYEHIRDFIVLHYHLNHRDEPLWQFCKNMDIPETLRQKIRLFKSQGRLFTETDELFAQGSWWQVMQGQGMRPRGYDPIVDVVDVEDLSAFFDGIKRAIQACIKGMPTHEDFLKPRSSPAEQGAH